MRDIKSFLAKPLLLLTMADPQVLAEMFKEPVDYCEQPEILDASFNKLNHYLTSKKKNFH